MVFGRPEWDKIFTGIKEKHPGKRVGVFVCGPEVSGSPFAPWAASACRSVTLLTTQQELGSAVERRGLQLGCPVRDCIGARSCTGGSEPYALAISHGTRSRLHSPVT